MTRRTPKWLRQAQRLIEQFAAVTEAALRHRGLTIADAARECAVIWPERSEVYAQRQVRRLLRRDVSLLYTDVVLITGILTNREVTVRLVPDLSTPRLRAEHTQRILERDEDAE